MKVIHILTGIRFSVLTSLLARNSISFYPKYILKLLVLFYNAIISSVLTRVERKIFFVHIRETTIEKPPVFIIGHWRTGSTYLHQLISLDPQFTTPSMVQTVIPDHFLFSTKYYVPLMKLLMPKKRPMDEVVMSPMEPQEDEFALIRMGSESPLERLIFPPKHKYFLYDYDEYIPQGIKLEFWKQNLITFYKKITWLTGKQIIAKNPFHTMRISLLSTMFPGAKFIYIDRHPFEVIPSTIKMWNAVAEDNSLNRYWKKPEIAEVASVLCFFNNYVSIEKQQLDKQNFAEVRFENLEKNPVNEIKRLYMTLNLEFSPVFKRNIEQFLISNRNYRKNIHRLTAEEKNLIMQYMGGKL